MNSLPIIMTKINMDHFVRKLQRSVSPFRRQHSRVGAAAVEFAISMLVLFLIIFGAIEMVRLSMVQHAVEHASYVTARKAMIIGANSKDAIEAGSAFLENVGISDGSVTIDPAKITDETNVVTAMVVVPIVGNTWISPIYQSGSIEGKTSMLSERAAAEMAP